MEKNKKKVPILLASIMAVLLIAAGIILLLNIIDEETYKPNEETSKPNEGTDKTEKINIAEIKSYLEENYDKFNIDGSSSMIPLHQSLNDLFSASEYAVVHSKTVDAFEKLISGENDILLGVDYSDELLDKAQKSGTNLDKKAITRDGFVFLINRNNPVKSLTIAQIKDIYSGKITNWSQVGGDHAPIKAYQRNSDSGSQIRMTKFMDNTKLAEKDVEYISRMGYVVEQVANYDKERHSIAYNMYTFTEKQYTNDEVILLDVNGIHPDDHTIFDETYPIVIYNYIYCDNNNELASEFANNLYQYLMSDEGQKLISDSGYVNLNKKYDKNKDINKPYDSDDDGKDIGFYNKEKGEFYDLDENGELLIFKSYPDYVLKNTTYKDNANARNYLAEIFHSSIPIIPLTVQLSEAEGTISLHFWSFDLSMDPEDFFKIKYNGKYYDDLIYFIVEDKYLLTGVDKELFDSYDEGGELVDFDNYKSDVVFESTLEITKDELKNLCLRTINYDWEQKELEYFQPFK